MRPEDWVNLVVALSFGVLSFVLLRLYAKRKTLVELYFSLATVSIAIPYGSVLFLEDQWNLIEWGRLIAITFYISGLLVYIRESKPPFARFPVYLTALPFVSFLFFPLVIDSIAIKNLVNAVYQGGALIVTLLIFTINNAKNKGRRYYVMGLGLIVIAYLAYWIPGNDSIQEYIWAIKLIFTVGIFITVLRFIRDR